MELTQNSIFFIFCYAFSGLHKGIAKIILEIFNVYEIILIYMTLIFFILMSSLIYQPIREKFIEAFVKCKKKCTKTTIFIFILFTCLIIGHTISTMYLVDIHPVSHIMPLAEVLGTILIILIGLIYFKESIDFKTVLALGNMLLGMALMIEPNIKLDVDPIEKIKKPDKSNKKTD